MTKTRPSSGTAADSIVPLGDEPAAVAADNAGEPARREDGGILHPAPISGHPPEASQLLDNGPPMFLADLDGNIIYANRQYRRFAEATAFDRTGTAVALRPAFPIEDVIREIEVSGQPIEREEIIEIQGHPRYLSARYIPVHDEANELSAVGGIYQNETALTAARLRAKTAEARFDDISRLVSDWIWETDPRFNLTFVSARILETLRLHPRTVWGTNLFDLGAFKQPDAEDARELPGPSTRSPFRDLPFEITSGEGETRLFRLSGLPVFDDDTGAFEGYRGTAQDITAETEAGERALRSEQRLSAAIDNISEGFALFSGDDRLVLCNDQLRVYFSDISAHLDPGTPFIQFAHALGTLIAGETRGNLDAWIESHANGSPQGSLELNLRDGRWLKVSERANQDGGTVAIVSDITELKEREEALRAARDLAEQASRSKSEFLANMSHELRTPLNAIIGFSEVMKNQVFGPMDNERYLGYAADITDSGQHLLGIISDILEVSKAEGGKLELDEEEVDVAAACEGAARLFTQQTLERGIEMTVKTADYLPPLRADKTKIKQILLNLISNAVKFTPEGGEVTVTARIDGDGAMILAVADTGIGIAEEDMAKAVSAFGQVASSHTRNHEGMGLGLPLTMALVELHGATLELDSAPGKGTTATVHFPASRVVS